jgi:hypothetical protein
MPFPLRHVLRALELREEICLVQSKTVYELEVSDDYLQPVLAQPVSFSDS